MPATSIWVVVDGDPAVAGLLDAARRFGPVTALVAGSAAVADVVARAGVERVVHVAVPEAGPAVPVEALAAQVSEIVAAAAPSVVVGAARESGRVLLGAVAARLQAPIVTSIQSLTADGDVVRSVHGGIAEQTVRVAGAPTILAVVPGAVPEAGADPTPVEVVAAVPNPAVSVRETRPAVHERADLSSARVVVSVGRGLKSRDDLALIDGLAKALGAEVACSRPLAEGHDWLPQDRYVGISGIHIAPEVYVAIGISGQIQHMVGVKEARTIVAVNSDPDAPILAASDYAVVGDLYRVVPALTAALTEA